MAEFDDEDEELETGDESDPAKRRKPLEEAADAKLNPSPSIGTPIVPPQQPGPAAALAQPKSIGTPMMQEAAPPDLGTGLTTPQSIGSPIAPQGSPALPHRPSSSDPEFQPQVHHGARALLDHLAVGAAAYGSPQLGEATAHRLFDQPNIDAANKLKTAQGGYDTEFAQGEKQRTDAANNEFKRAEAEKLLHPNAVKLSPAVIAGPNGEPMAASFNPTTGQYHDSTSGQVIPNAKKYEKPGADTKITHSYVDDKGNEVGVFSDGSTKVLGKTKPQKEPQEPGSYMPLYDEKGHVVGAWNAKTGHVNKAPTDLPGTTSQGQTISSKADTAQQKAIKPYQSVIEMGQTAHQLADMAEKGNAEADVDLALLYFKAIKGADGGGIRYTLTEASQIQHAREAAGDIEAIGQKVIGSGQQFTPDQRSKITQVIDLHSKLAQQALQRLQGGGGSGAAAPTGGTAPPGGPASGSKLDEIINRHKPQQPNA